MRRDENGAYLLERGDVCDVSIDPNLTAGWFQVVRDGDGDESSFVELVGFGIGDPTVVKAKRGALVRAVPQSDEFMLANNAEPLTAEQKREARSWVSVVNSAGVKTPLGQWPEAEAAQIPAAASIVTFVFEKPAAASLLAAPVEAAPVEAAPVEIPARLAPGVLVQIFSPGSPLDGCRLQIKGPVESVPGLYCGVIQDGAQTGEETNIFANQVRAVAAAN